MTREGMGGIRRACLFAPVAFLCLTAGMCKTADRSEPVVRTVEVKVPVKVPCSVEVVIHGSYTDDTADQVDDIFVKVQRLLIGREERKEDSAKLAGGVRACGGTVR